MENRTMQESPELDEVRDGYKTMSDMLEGREIIPVESIAAVAKEEIKPIRKWYKDQYISLLIVIPLYIFLAVYGMDSIPQWVLITALVMSIVYCSVYVICSRYLAQVEYADLDMVSAAKKTRDIMKVNRLVDVARVVVFIPLAVWLVMFFKLGVTGGIILAFTLAVIFLINFKESRLRYKHIESLLKELEDFQSFS